jgi:putative PIN family toxin of toxin-antitoxin system
VVVDTSVIISAFAFGGFPELAIRKVFNESNFYVSNAILKEYRSVPLSLEANGKINHRQLKALISGIASFATKAKLVHPTKKLSVCRDASEDMILECCLAAKANLLISSDRDLLDMVELPFGIEIISPRYFVENC